MRNLLALGFLAALGAGCGSSTGTDGGGSHPDLSTIAGGDLAVAPGDMAVAPGDMAGGPTTFTVHVGANGLNFAPQLLSIKAGDTVHWVWDSSGHNVVSGSPGVADNKFCSPNSMNCSSAPTSNTGATYDHLFAAAGTFAYFCAPHAGAGMTATVVVQ